METQLTLQYIYIYIPCYGLSHCYTMTRCCQIESHLWRYHSAPSLLVLAAREEQIIEAERLVNLSMNGGIVQTTRLGMWYRF